MHSVRPHDLHRDLTEELAVPRPEDLVARATTESTDHDQRSIDLLANGEIPALPGRRDYLCHSLTLRPTDGCTSYASTTRKRAPGLGALFRERAWLLLP